MSLQITQSTSGNISTLVLTGDLDTATAGQLESVVKEILAGEQPGIVFDMGGITYVSSFGLRVIIYTSKAMRAYGDRFAMHSVQEDVMEILKLSGLSKLLKVVPSQAEAVAALAE